MSKAEKDKNPWAAELGRKSWAKRKKAFKNKAEMRAHMSSLRKGKRKTDEQNPV